MTYQVDEPCEDFGGRVADLEEAEEGDKEDRKHAVDGDAVARDFAEDGGRFAVKSHAV